MKNVVLQVALDILELKRALQIAQESLEGGADWIEVGTPLIKSEGMQAIRSIRDHFPDSMIVADMKVADTGTM
jgi:3-hexulose-6-phosphate synthase/6-phospho-3-hexuloisomerase